jgi:hypothetical protein
VREEAERSTNFKYRHEKCFAVESNESPTVSALNLFDDTCIRVVVYVWLSVCGSQKSEF